MLVILRFTLRLQSKRCVNISLEILSCVQHLSEDQCYEVFDIVQDPELLEINIAMPPWVPDWNVSITKALAPPLSNSSHRAGIDISPEVSLTSELAPYDSNRVSLNFPIIRMKEIQFAKVRKCLPPMYVRQPRPSRANTPNISRPTYSRRRVQGRKLYIGTVRLNRHSGPRLVRSSRSSPADHDV